MKNLSNFLPNILSTDHLPTGIKPDSDQPDLLSPKNQNSAS